MEEGRHSRKYHPTSLEKTGQTSTGVSSLSKQCSEGDSDLVQGTFNLLCQRLKFREFFTFVTTLVTNQEKTFRG